MTSVTSWMRSRFVVLLLSLTALAAVGSTTVAPAANARKHPTTKHKKKHKKKHRTKRSHREPDADNRGGPDDGDGAK